MDNGSKAVIIAGTILIVLFVASFIIIFFNRSSRTAQTIHDENIGSDVMEFNTQFTIYGGKNKTKSDVDKLISKVNSSNKTSGHWVDINYFGVSPSGIVGYGYSLYSPGTNLISVKDDGKIQLYVISFNMDSLGRINLIKIEQM